MELKDYFENTRGMGVMATADDKGKVDAAIYARPHFLKDGNLAFIMRDRLTHHNLQSNPHATFLFVEDGRGYKGKRLFMTKIAEEENSPLLQNLRRRQYPDEKETIRFLAIFELNDVLPLIGSGDSTS